MTVEFLLAQTAFERNPIQDYLTSKAGLLWSILFAAAAIGALAWLAETKSEANIPAGILAGAPAVAAGAVILLLASL